jgi:hypothetical protein
MIHEIAINSLTLLLGVALPLLRKLSGTQVASESSAETETVALEQQLDSNTLTRSTAATPRSSVACVRGNRASEGSTPSSGVPLSASSKRSNDSNERVLEWNGLTQIDFVVGQASCRKKRPREESRQNCVHAPFTMRFANSVFQGRGTHDMWRPRAREATQKQDCEVRLGEESIQPIRLFPDISESEKACERPHPDTRACSTSNSKTCGCCSSNPLSTNWRIDC